MQLTDASTQLLAGVLITLAFFTLVAHLVKALRHTLRLPLVIGALASLVGVLPVIIYALDVTAGPTA
ncbi:hypothetical protein [Streptomyces sp. NPDC047315]|uniref:hypothetical protein n=1 Tax=Streptomyces sp. NPDC047315 TaxID=3155142 RepID=UPI00340AE3BE